MMEQVRYEYTAANHRNLEAEEIARICNEYAVEGWNLISVTAGGISGALLTFRRPINQKGHPLHDG